MLQRIFDCPSLEELRLQNLSFRSIEHLPMESLSNKVTKLKTLDISMSIITEELLIQILKNTRNLEYLIMGELELAWWEHLTDEDMLPIISHCKKLSHLNIEDASQISLVTLARTCENLPNLRQICTSCEEMTEEMVNNFEICFRYD
ncbi:hypothetical protein ABEB36_014072 [Hypothenemus hampei]|uniref:Uncharacterized protein n=1 Tax=Hypothenemus hampei TaxID=57062 RepID=A0ABD1E375_HYPHA